MARPQMIKSVGRLVSGEHVLEAVVLQQRRRFWFLALAVAAGLGVLIASVVDAGVIIRGAIVGGFVGAGFAPVTTSWILARTTSELLLCRSRRLFISATEVAQRWPAGEPVERVGSVLGGDIYEIGGDRYIGSKMFRQRIENIGAPVGEYP